MSPVTQCIVKNLFIDLPHLLAKNVYDNMKHILLPKNHLDDKSDVGLILKPLIEWETKLQKLYDQLNEKQLELDAKIDEDESGINQASVLQDHTQESENSSTVENEQTLLDEEGSMASIDKLRAELNAKKQEVHDAELEAYQENGFITCLVDKIPELDQEVNRILPTYMTKNGEIMHFRNGA